MTDVLQRFPRAPRYTGTCRADDARSQAFERRWPLITWREPQPVFRVDDPEQIEHYACRLCVALWGMRSADVPRLFTDRDTVAKMIEEAHGR